MNSLVLTLAVDHTTPGKAIGIKEAIAMDLEKYGDVRVLQVDVREPEQLRLGAEPPEQSNRCSYIQASGQAPAPSAPDRPEPHCSRSTELICCLNCDLYRKQSGQDKAGTFYWGICRRTGRPVYSLMGQCDAWVRKEGRS